MQRDSLSLSQNFHYDARMQETASVMVDSPASAQQAA